MKRLPRLLWLLAWSLWLLLGVGLHRELPRQLGPRVGHIPLEAGDTAAFIKDTHHVAVQPPMGRHRQGLKLYDADTGAMLREISFERRWPALPPLVTASWHGVVVTETGERRQPTLEVLDLETDRATPVATLPIFNPAVHPTRPWIAFRESAGPIDKPRPLVVIDWTTGAEVFIRPRGTEYVHLAAPVFLGDTDRLLVPVSPPPGPDSRETTVLEVWRLGPNQLEKVLRIPEYHYTPIETSRSGGRIMWSATGLSGGMIHVYDVDAERMVFSRELLGLPAASMTQQWLRTPELSRSGRALMVVGIAALWNVDTGRPLWSQRDWRPPVLLDDDSFAEREKWEAPTNRVSISLSHWNTTAVRDLDTAALHFRCWEGDAAVLECRSADGALGVSHAGAVHRLPFRPDWLLLAASQLILALPLLLLWTLLRVRRRRAAQRQPTPLQAGESP